MSDELVVGITGINACDNPAPGVGVAKSLLEATDLNVKIIGLAYDAMEPGIYLDNIINHAFLIPYPAAGSDALIARLLYIKEKKGLDVLIPTMDSELPFYIKYRDVLNSHGIKTFIPSKEQFRLRDKEHLVSIAEESGLTAPAQAVVSNYDELNTAVSNIGLPVMVKGALYNAYAANTLEEAMSHFSRVVAQSGYPVIVQKKVTGEEMNVIGVGDGTGGHSGLVAIKKMSVTGLGKIWTGVTVHHQGLLEMARCFVKSTHWRGAFEMECMVDQDKAYLIEINPRFPAWVYFATGVGCNLPLALVKHALNQPVLEPEKYPAGKLYIRFTDELVCDLTQFQNMVTLGESL